MEPEPPRPSVGAVETSNERRPDVLFLGTVAGTVLVSTLLLARAFGFHEPRWRFAVIFAIAFFGSIVGAAHLLPWTLKLPARHVWVLTVVGFAVFVLVLEAV